MPVEGGEATVVLENLGAEDSGLALSPDERWLLYTRLDRAESDLLLLDGFR